MTVRRSALRSFSSFEGRRPTDFRPAGGNLQPFTAALARPVRLSGVPYHVRSAQTFGALLALELDGLAFIQGPIARILNRGKVDEHVFAARPLDKPITFCAIEPLHYAMLFHWKLLVVVGPLWAPASDGVSRLPGAAARQEQRHQKLPFARPAEAVTGSSVGYRTVTRAMKQVHQNKLAFLTDSPPGRRIVLLLWQETPYRSSKKMVQSMVFAGSYESSQYFRDQNPNATRPAETSPFRNSHHGSATIF